MLKHNGDTAAVGEVIGYMEETAAEPADAGSRRGRPSAGRRHDSHASQATRPRASRRIADGRRHTAAPPADEASQPPRDAKENRPRRRPRAKPAHGGAASPRRSDRGLVVSPKSPRPPAGAPPQRPARPSAIPMPHLRPGTARARKKRCR